MSEYKGQISGLIEKMSTQAQSRILKIEKIKEKFESKLASFSLQGSVIHQSILLEKPYLEVCLV